MRINRAIAGLEADQPIFYTGGHTGAELSFEAGAAMASSWADYINIGMEHGPWDPRGLHDFMRGLTSTGKPSPAVLVELPVEGASAELVRANAWQIRQLLAAGAHGLLLCHAESAEAVEAFVESVRYTFHGGRRGAGGQQSAAEIWGISADEYLQCAEPWPLSPTGELLLGLKVENTRALEAAFEVTRVPGIAFAEWGPGDMSMSFGYRGTPEDFRRPELLAARERVFEACRAAGIAFLEAANVADITAKIDEGVRVFAGADEQTASLGRNYRR